ncbi:hypothetical protein D9M70_254810 [compost metagenome]
MVATWVELTWVMAREVVCRVRVVSSAAVKALDESVPPSCSALAASTMTRNWPTAERFSNSRAHMMASSTWLGWATVGNGPVPAAGWATMQWSAWFSAVMFMRMPVVSSESVLETSSRSRDAVARTVSAISTALAKNGSPR